MGEPILSVVSSVATSAVLVWIFRTWISTRLKASIQHEYDQKLAVLNAELKYSYEAKTEILKSEFQREAEKLRFASSSFGESQKAVLIRRLDAIETYWKNVVSLQGSCPGIISMLDLLQPGEYAETIKNTFFKDLLESLEVKGMRESLEKATPHNEEIRIYVGEFLWSLFGAYQAILVRVILSVSNWRKDLQNLDWARDEQTLAWVQIVLGPTDYASFEALPFNRLNFVHSKVRDRILTSIQKVISGESLSVDALRQVEALEEIVQKSKEVLPTP